METSSAIIGFLQSVHPYDSLPQDELVRVAHSFRRSEVQAGAEIYHFGAPLDGIYLIKTGSVEVQDASGGLVSLLGPRNSFGERGLMRDGLAATTALALEDCVLLHLPAAEFHALMQSAPPFQRFFTRGRAGDRRNTDLAMQTVGDLMTGDPQSCGPEDTVQSAAARMRDGKISCLGVVEAGAFIGLVTTRDLTGKVLAAGLPASTPVRAVMSGTPISLPPEALGADVLNLMLERRIGHLPVVEAGRLIGMITQTDITRFQATSSAQLVRDLAGAQSVARMAAVTARIPQLLVQLVGGNTASGHHTADHRYCRYGDAAAFGLGRGKAWPRARALSLACLWQSGPPRADRRVRSGQLPVHRRCRNRGRYGLFRGAGDICLRRSACLRLCLLPRRDDGDQSEMVRAHQHLARLFPPLDRHT